MTARGRACGTIRPRGFAVPIQVFELLGEAVQAKDSCVEMRALSGEVAPVRRRKCEDDKNES